VPISDLTVHAGAVRPVPRGEGREELVRSKHFVTELVRMASGEECQPQPEACQIWICLEGSGTIGGAPYQRGEAWLLPEASGQPVLRANMPSRFLRTWAPH